MFDPELTSEDQLLKIIENPLAVKRSDNAPVRGSLWINVQVIFAEIKAGKFIEVLSRSSLRAVNRTGLILCSILTLICAINFSHSRVKFDKMFERMSAIAVVDPDVEKYSFANDVDFKRALTMAKQHNIFTLEHPVASSEGLMVGQSQEVANFKLVGIMWSDKPQAMIEDVIEQKTYLLSVGDQAGRLTVKSIEKDKVILGREDHIWELR